MSLPGTIRTRPPTIRKAQANAREMSVTAVLTAPGVDLAGDIVHPQGLDFAEHRAAPWNDLEHNGNPVGWARKSLSQPGAPYGVRFLDLDGMRLPVGTTWFDPSDRLSSQVFALCERDALPGVSVEFRPLPGLFKSLGEPARIPRTWPKDACEFFKVSVVRWTHCARPVNEGALTVTKSLAATDPLLSILSAGRVGSEQLHPVITKSLAQYLPPRRLVRVEKAMDENETVYDDAAPEVASPEPEEMPEDDGMPNNGVDAKYKLAQDLLDAADAYSAAMDSSDSPELHKLCAKFCAKINAIAEEIKGAADSHDSKLQAMKGGEDEPAEAEEPAEVDMDTDDEGVLKAVRPVYRKSLKKARGKRFSKSEIATAEVAELKKSLAKLTKKVAQL